MTDTDTTSTPTRKPSPDLGDIKIAKAPKGFVMPVKPGGFGVRKPNPFLDACRAANADRSTAFAVRGIDSPEKASKVTSLIAKAAVMLRTETTDPNMLCSFTTHYDAATNDVWFQAVPYIQRKRTDESVKRTDV
jgi:hypothetical protein